ncbi:MAG: hypothetical protein KDI88_05235 [Gammaproteobacteria bacterium]|nr:hypothetical protein [Gammaproteobacteria bacterium]
MLLEEDAYCKHSERGTITWSGNFARARAFGIDGTYGSDYIETMALKPDNVLTWLLIALLALGPVGTAMSSYCCAADPAQSAAAVADMGNFGHHGHSTDMTDAEGVSAEIPASNDCADGCCLGGSCNMGHCTGGAAVPAAQINCSNTKLSSTENTLTGDRPLAGRFAPPFRPPQI